MSNPVVVYQYTNLSNGLSAGSGVFGSWISIPAPLVPVDLVVVTFAGQSVNTIVQVGYGSAPQIVHNGYFISGSGYSPMRVPVRCPAGQVIQLRAGSSSANSFNFTVTGWSLGGMKSSDGDSILLSPGISPTSFFVGTAVGSTGVLLNSLSTKIKKIWLNFQPQQVATEFDIAIGPSTSSMETILTDILVSSSTGFPSQVLEAEVEIPPGNNIYITNVQLNEAYGSLNALI